MEKRNTIAQFTVSVTGTDRGTWQGCVTMGEDSFRFESEMELLHVLLEHHPALLPERPEFTK